MNTPKTSQILRLYKDILRYGQELKYTDKHYFYTRIKSEFKKNKALLNAEEISYNYEVTVHMNNLN